VTLPVGQALHHLAAAGESRRGEEEGEGKGGGGGDRAINGWLGKPWETNGSDWNDRSGGRMGFGLVRSR
jgi:hypothetical protein